MLYVQRCNVINCGFTVIKGGRFLRNVSTASICDHFTVVMPGSRIREVGLFWADHLGCDRCILMMPNLKGKEMALDPQI